MKQATMCFSCLFWNVDSKSLKIISKKYISLWNGATNQVMPEGNTWYLQAVFYFQRKNGWERKKLFSLMTIISHSDYSCTQAKASVLGSMWIHKHPKSTQAWPLQQDGCSPQSSCLRAPKQRSQLERKLCSLHLFPNIWIWLSYSSRR